MENQKDAMEDLAFIRQVMNDAQRLAEHSAFSPFLWGLVVILATALSYLLHGWGEGQFIPWVWGVLMPTTAVIDHFHDYRVYRQQLSTLSNRILVHVSISVTVSLVLLTFVVGGLAGFFTDWRLYYIIVQMILGMAVFIFGGIYDMTALKKLAIVQWAGSTLIAFLPPFWVPLEFGVFVGAGFLWAGFMLKRFASEKAHRDPEWTTTL